MMQVADRIAAVWVVVVAIVVPGCVADPPGGGIRGDASMMTTPPGDHAGYTLAACAEPARWLVTGTGTRYFRDTPPGSAGRTEAVIALGSAVVTPAVSELTSVVATGGASIACRSELTPVSSASVYDWAEIDKLIERLGAALAERDLREIVEVAIEGPIGEVGSPPALRRTR